MKSKKILFIIMLFVLALNHAEYAQEITEGQKQQYILNLADSTKSWGAILSVVKYKVSEAIPTIIEQIWNKDSYEQILFLKALYYLKSDRAKEFIYQYLSRVDSYDLTDETIKAISLKGDAASILVNLGDFSQRQFIYDDIEKKHPEEFPEQIFTLFRILENYPPDKEKATNLLKKIAEDSPNPINRGYVIRELYKFYGDEIIPFVIERFEVEGTKDDSLRADSAFPHIFSTTRSEIAHQFLQNYLMIDANIGIGASIILIDNWGTPKDYKIVKNKLEKIDDEEDKDFLTSRLEEEVLVKKHVNAILNIARIVDTLLSYQSQCLELNWLGGVAFSEQLKPFLLDAKAKLAIGDSLGAAFKINQYQSAIVHAYQDPVTNTNQFVTSDGYKFLYYYPKYILERLPQLPIIKTITPAITVTKTKEFILSVEGNYFRPASVVSWNGKPRTTTFVSNTLLQTKIDLNDLEDREDKERKDGDEKKVKDGEITIPVLVTTNKWINTDTLTFRLYKKLQYSVLPFLNCIVEISQTKYEAWFGYDNKNEGSVLLDHASENKFDPAPQDRGQPTVFLPGKHDKVFSVEFEGNKKLMWKLDKEKAEASKDSPRCK